MYNFRTDLALERREILNKMNKQDVDGIEVEESSKGEKIKISKVKVTNENGENAIRKTKTVLILQLILKNLKLQLKKK